MSNDAVSDVQSLYYEGTSGDDEDEKIFVRGGPLWIRQVCCLTTQIFTESSGDSASIITFWDWDGVTEVDARQVTQVGLTFWLATSQISIPDDAYLQIKNDLFVSTSGALGATTSASKIKVTVFFT